MKKILAIFLLFIFFTQCKDTNSIKTELTTDLEEIAWRNLEKSKNQNDFSAFVQNYPKSKYIQSAAQRYLALRDSIIFDFYGCGKYSAEIHPVDSTRVLFNGELIETDSLKLKTFNYLTSELVNTIKIKIPRSREFGLLSTGHIHCVVMPNSTGNRYLQETIIQASDGIKKYRDYISNDWYGKNYMDLMDSTKVYVDKLFENKISLLHYYEPTFPVPVLNK